MTVGGVAGAMTSNETFVRGDSTLPALSTDQNSRVWVPVVVTLTMVPSACAAESRR